MGGHVRCIVASLALACGLLGAPAVSAEPASDAASGEAASSTSRDIADQGRLVETAEVRSGRLTLPPVGSARPGVEFGPDGGSVQRPRSEAVLGPRIINGSAVPITAAPWQVGLLTRANSNPYQAQFCGGSIYAQEWIITAAHCVAGLSASAIDVLAGADFLANAVSGYAGRTPVDQIIVHPGWNTETYENDVALLRLASPLTYDDSTQPISLPNFSDWPASDDTGFISGWGNTSTIASAYPQNLQGADVDILGGPSDSNCGSYGDEYIPSVMLCAGTQTLPRIDTCQGDSGGPLAVQVASTWYLAGITSWGRGCALAGYPGVYTRVTAFTSWIEQMVLPNSTGSVQMTLSQALANPGMCLFIFPASEVGAEIALRCDITSDDTVAVADLAPGDYTAFVAFYDDFVVPFWYSPAGPQSKRADAATFSVAAATQTNLSSSTETGGAIRVSLGPDDPLASPDVCIGAWGEVLGDFAAINCAGSNVTVAYLTGLPVDDTYYLQSYDSYGDYADQWYSSVVTTGVAAIEVASPVYVDTSTVTPISMALTAPAEITGTILDPDGMPLPGQRGRAMLWLSPDQPAAWITSRPADGSGSYRFDYLPPGDYAVEFYDSQDVYGSEWFDDTATRSAATTVSTLEDMVTTGVSATLAPAALAVSAGPDDSVGERVPVSIELHNAFGVPYAPSTDLTLTLTSSNSGQFFAGMSGGSAITTVDLSTLDTFVTVWFTNTRAGDDTITVGVAGGTGPAPGLDVISLSPGTPAGLQLASVGSSLTTGSAATLAASVVDDFGNIVIGDSSTSVTFAQTSGTGSVSGLGVSTASSGVARKAVTGGSTGVVTITASAPVGDDSITFEVVPAPVPPSPDPPSPVPPVEAPGPPQEVAVATGPVTGSVTVSWASPTSGGAPTSYRVEYRPSAGGEWVDAGDGLQSGAVIPGLEPGVAYVVRVAAVNTAGTSDFAESANAAPAALARPATVEGIGGSEPGTIAVTWSAVPRADGYVVESRLVGATSWVRAADASPGTGLLLAGLTPGGMYDVRVAALVGDVESGFTETPGAVRATAEPAPPGPVTPLVPGTTEVTEDGKRVNIEVQTEGDDTGLNVSGPGFAIGLASSKPSGGPSRLGSQRQIVLDPFGSLVLNGEGFGQGQVDVYLIKPRQPRALSTGYLGSVSVGASGLLAGRVEIPGDFAGGEAVLRLVGSAPSGAERALSLGVSVRSKAKATIMITGSRAGPAGRSKIVVSGVSTGLTGSSITPRFRLAGQGRFSAGRPFTVAKSGEFRWTRKTVKKATVFMQAGEVRSNRVKIKAAPRR